LPAITIGCLDSDGLAPRSHQAGDVQDRLDRGSIDRLLELALTLVDAIDADLRPSHRQAPTSHHQAPPGTTRHE
jgi:hypothetical protein